MPRRTGGDEHSPEVTERRGMRTEGNAVDESEAMTGVDLDEGDLEFFEEDQSEDED